SEVVAVEIVRTMCGSIGLVAAVPISTGLAALVTGPTTGIGDPPTPEVSWDDFGPDREFWSDD
ncbi:MAG: YibE/F family protein, partial [Actinomycetota bacterium]